VVFPGLLVARRPVLDALMGLDWDVSKQRCAGGADVGSCGGGGGDESTTVCSTQNSVILYTISNEIRRAIRAASGDVTLELLRGPPSTSPSSTVLWRN